jgi:hypothetical protein
MSDFYTPPTPPLDFNFDSTLPYSEPPGTSVNFVFIQVPVAGTAAASSEMVGDIVVNYESGPESQGSVQVDSAVSGDLTTEIRNSADVSADSIASADLTTEISVSGSAQSDSQATGALVTNVAGAAQADSTAEGDLTTSIELSGEVKADSRVYLEQPLEAEPVITDSQVTGNLTHTPAYIGAAQVDSAATGVLSDGTVGVNALPVYFTGFYLYQPNQDYYNRFHITPDILDAFDFVLEEPLKFSVWNSYLTAVPLSSVQEIRTDGLSLAAVPTPDSNYFSPMENRNYEATLTDFRRKDFDVQYNFLFNTVSDAVSVVINGRRLDVCPFHPDRALPIIEKREWRTEVLTAYNGTEQRIKTRKIPRRHLQFDTFIPTQHQPLYQNLFYGLAGQSLCVPLWIQQMPLTSAVSAGSYTLPVNTTDSDLGVGSLVILMSTDLVYQVFKIQSLTSSAITATTPIRRSWPKGATLYPLGAGTLNKPAVMRRHHAAVAQGTLDFMLTKYLPEIPAADTNPVYGADGSGTFWGIPVFEDVLDWNGDIKVTYDRKLSVWDNETGTLAYDIEGKIPTRTQAFRQFLNTPAKIRKLQQWLSSQSGKVKPFWLPSGCNDFVLTKDIAETDTTITVKRTEFSSAVGVNLQGRDIRIQFKKRSRGLIYYARIIEAVAISEQEEQLTIRVWIPHLALSNPGYSTTALGYWVDGTYFSYWTLNWRGESATKDSVAMISLMTQARLEDDAVEIKHYNPSFATAEFNIKGIVYDV